MTCAAEITVLGAGSWGTALAILLARNGHSVRLWGRNPERIKNMQVEHCNRVYLPEHTLPDNLYPEADLEAAVTGIDTLLIAVPSHCFREQLQALAPLLSKRTRIAWATKGLETGTGKFLHQVVGEVLGSRYQSAIISGPTFAGEVAAGLPAAATVASGHPRFATELAALLHGNTFRAYTSTDVLGVELGGASKNVMAIAAGIADGLGFGANSRAALITRGLAEIMRLGNALGGKRETFVGLAGLGDLVLTCTDDQSRNRRLGLALGRGASLEEAITAIGQVVEGVNTTSELEKMATAHQIDMPITDQVHRVLNKGLAPRDAVHTLLSRQPRAESF